MPKAKTHYICTECGTVHAKWAGKCQACGAWDTITEDVSASGGFSKSNANKEGKTLELSSLADPTSETRRISTTLQELDRVFGGGLVEGSAILIGGDPGIGKSTLLLQLLAALSKQHKTLYVTGEESVNQVKLRAERLGMANAGVALAANTSVADIIQTIRSEQPKFVVIDSIQTMYIPNLESAPGTVSQVRTASHELIQLAKQTGTTLILVGHVTKDGSIAGPKLLEHMVDTVLYFEGDSGMQYRIVRAVKNRFGAAGEIGVFDMTSEGLQEVTNPSGLFISQTAGSIPGSVVFPAVEGSRTMMVEIQALVCPTPTPQPRRAVVGWDANRLAMLLAVLQTRSGMKLYDKEVYLNVAGGMRVNEPAADLAVAAAIASALANIPVRQESVIFGEVGLSGEIRPAPHTESRVKESAKLGFTQAILPQNQGKKAPIVESSFILTPIRSIIELTGLMANEANHPATV